MAEYIFLDRNENITFRRADAIRFVVHEDKYSLDASFDLDAEKEIEAGMHIGFYDLDNTLQFYEVQNVEVDTDDEIVIIQAFHSAMTELLDEIIIDNRPTRVEAGVAVSVALEGSRWSMRSAQATDIASCRFWYMSRWACLQKIVEKWGCALKFSWQIDDNGISARYVDVVQRLGENRGRRFEIGKNFENVSVIYDDSDVYTALIGRGAAKEYQNEDEDDYAYGRKLSFADVEWSISGGNPADKPLNQEWVEDTIATSLYGRSGRKRMGVVTFDECDDASELLEMTWQALQLVNAPKVTVRGKLIDLEMIWGGENEIVRLGDDIAAVVETKSFDYAIETKVTEIDRDYINPLNTNITFGNIVMSIADIQSNFGKALQNISSKADVGEAIKDANPDLLRGIIDTMTTQILSSGTHMYTDENDGSLIFETDDGSAAVKITGGGVLISNQKESGAWQWSTALNGNGIVASVITSGVLRANLVKILGTDRFYWDSQNIYIFDTNDNKKQIRIGLYDGVNYGIGYTQDGGDTWNNAISFDGVHLSAGSVSKSDLNQSLQQEIESDGFHAGTTAPVSPTLNMIWLDTSTHPATLKRWNGSIWDECQVTREEYEAISAKTAQYESELSLVKGEISGKVSEQRYISDQASMASQSYVEERLSSELAIMSDSVMMNFNSAKGMVQDVDGDLQEFIDEVRTYIRFSLNGIELGKSIDSFKVIIDNEKIQFLQDGEVIAYISNHRLYISEARTTQRLSIGTVDHGYFDWVSVENGIGLKWRG